MKTQLTKASKHTKGIWEVKANEMLEALQRIQRLSSVIPVEFQQSIWDVINPILEKNK